MTPEPRFALRTHSRRNRNIIIRVLWSRPKSISKFHLNRDKFNFTSTETNSISHLWQPGFIKHFSPPGKLENAVCLWETPRSCVFPCDCPCEREASAQLSWGKPSRMGRVGWHQHLPASPAPSQGGCIASVASCPLKDTAQEQEGTGLDVPRPTRRSFAITAGWGNPRQAAPAKFWFV